MHIKTRIDHIQSVNSLLATLARLADVAEQVMAELATSTPFTVLQTRISVARLQAEDLANSLQEEIYRSRGYDLGPKNVIVPARIAPPDVVDMYVPPLLIGKWGGKLVDGDKTC